MLRRGQDIKIYEMSDARIFGPLDD